MGVILTAKGYQEIFWGVMEMFYIWVKMVVVWLYTFVKTHQTVSRLKISAFYYMQILSLILYAISMSIS